MRNDEMTCSVTAEKLNLKSMFIIQNIRHWTEELHLKIR